MMSPGCLTMACIGDVLIADRTLAAVQRLGTAAAAERIWEPLAGVDVILANLEVPITEAVNGPEDKLFRFSTCSDILSLFDQRFVLSLANNHVLDRGERGLMDTLEALDSQGLSYAGAGRNLEEARRPAVIHVGGVKAAAVCAADPRFQAATETSAGVFPAQPELLRESIQEIRNDVELVAISIHAGVEFMSLPSSRQVRLAELCLEEGARIVSFHHSHCISGLLRDRRGVVFFGTGDYVFPAVTGARSRLRRESAVWKVTFAGTKPDIAGVQIHPVVLDDDGLPAAVTGRQSRKILERIERYSRRIQRSQHLGWWYMRDKIGPQRIVVVIDRLLYIARRRGIGFMVQALVRQVVAQRG